MNKLSHVKKYMYIYCFDKGYQLEFFDLYTKDFKIQNIDTAFKELYLTLDSDFNDYVITSNKYLLRDIKNNDLDEICNIIIELYKNFIKALANGTKFKNGIFLDKITI